MKTISRFDGTAGTNEGGDRICNVLCIRLNKLSGKLSGKINTDPRRQGIHKSESNGATIQRLVQ